MTVSKKTYITELSEVRMVRRAPEGPFALGDDDRSYIGRCLSDVETAFGLKAFPGLAFEAIPARSLIEKLIYWWRTLEPADEVQREAHSRLPAAIRLLDTVSIWMEEREHSKGSGARQR